MVNDPVADFINRIKTAQLVGLSNVSIPFSKMKFEIASLLFKEGYVGEVKKHGKKAKRFIEVTLKYENGKPEVRGVKRLSKPSRRVYVKSTEIRPVKYGHGLLVVSTPKGLLTGRDARKEKVGGEALFSIW